MKKPGVGTLVKFMNFNTEETLIYIICHLHIFISSLLVHADLHDIAILV